MAEFKMESKLFCSAKIRPDYCIVETNICCFNCEHRDSCVAKTIQNNKSRKLKSVVPCTEANILSAEICEFAC